MMYAVMLFLFVCMPALQCMEQVSPPHIMRYGTQQHAAQDILIELDEAPLSRQAWEQELTAAIKDCKSARLVHLLSPQGKPASTRSGLPGFTPHETAIEQIQKYKKEKQHILTNTNPDSKRCKSCNSKYLWNRAVAPSAILVFAFAQLGFSIWSVQRAASTSLIQNPNSNLQAFIAAGPSIGALISAVGSLLFAFPNARNFFLLKEIRKEYEYYVLAEHNVQTQQRIENMLTAQSQQLQLLVNREQQTLASAPRKLLHSKLEVADSDEVQVESFEGSAPLPLAATKKIAEDSQYIIDL